MGMAERQGEEILWATVALRACGLKLTQALPRRDLVNLRVSPSDFELGKQK